MFQYIKIIKKMKKYLDKYINRKSFNYIFLQWKELKNHFKYIKMNKIRKTC